MMQFITHSSKSFPLAIPEDLRAVLSKIKQQHYEELYEDITHRETTSFETAFKELLDTIHSLDASKAYYRYIWMALLLSFAVKPTIKAYLRNDRRPKIVIIFTLIQLKQAQISETIDDILRELLKSPNSQLTLDIEKAIAERKLLREGSKGNETIKPNNQEYCLPEIINGLFPNPSEGCQALDEGLDVFKNVLRTLDQTQAKVALLEILDECFEGYAIFPGSSRRRDLFNWWIDEIVPATWNFQPPKSLYTVRGVREFETILKKTFWQAEDTILLCDLCDRFCVSEGS